MTTEVPRATESLSAATAAPQSQVPIPAPPGLPPAPPGRTGFGEPPGPGWYPAIPGVPTDRSSYLDMLPGIYQESHFLGRFLLIFESVLGPIERTVDNISEYFNPDLTPPECVAWLGSWLGLVLDERWPEERRRGIIRAAVDLFQWRGTRRGLREFVRLYTGITPEIIEPSLGDVASNPRLAFRFTLRLAVPPGTTVDPDLLESIIDLEKPAFAACTLELVRADQPTGTGDGAAPGG